MSRVGSRLASMTPGPAPDSGPSVTAPITRRRLREDVRDALLRLFTEGDLLPGMRIKEADLAGRLGVSRTPLREALMTLEKEGFLESRPSKGFSVLPLTVEEVRETYPIIWALEKLSLDQAEADHIDIARLMELNAQLSRVDDPEESNALDTEFHATLVRASANSRLSQLLDTLKLAARRYESAHLRDDRLMAVSRQQHDAIVRACARRDFVKAAELVEAHWRFGMESILGWLGGHERGA